MKALNVWSSTPDKLVYYNLGEPIYKNGDFAVYKEFEKSYLYTYKDVAVNNLGAANKDYDDALAADQRPEGVAGYLFDRAKEAILRASKLTEMPCTT